MRQIDDRAEVVLRRRVALSLQCQVVDGLLTERCGSVVEKECVRLSPSHPLTPLPSVARRRVAA